MAEIDDLPVGKRYQGGEWTIEADAFRRYAAATDDRNPAYEGADAVAPPMFHTRAMIGLMLQMATDPELEIDHLRLVHGEHAMRFNAPLRDGDVLVLGGNLERVEQKHSGRVFTFSLDAEVDGRRVLEGSTAYFIRARTRSDAPRQPREPAPEPAPPTWSLIQEVTKDQAIRYAASSGDGNPIHTDEEVARRAGLPGTILHGLCTLAFAARDVVNHSAAGDPTALEELAVRWARPVFPGTQLTLQVWEEPGDDLQFRTLGPDGKPVLVQGRARLRG